MPSRACSKSIPTTTPTGEPDKLNLRVEGLTIDAIYDGFVRQIAGDRLASTTGSTTGLKDAVERDNRRQVLLKQISALGKR